MIQAFFWLAAVRKPAGVVAAVLCMYGLEQWAQASSPYFVNHGKLINLVTGLLVVTALTVKFFRNDLHAGKYPATGWASLALYGVAVASFFWTGYRSGWVERMDLMFPYIITVAILMPMLVYDIRDLRTGLYYMLIVGSVLAVLLALTVTWTYRGIELKGAVGTKGNPLAVASMGGYVCIIAALMNFRGISRVWQLLRWPVMAFGFYLPIVSGSRGQLIALVPVIGLLIPMSRRFTNWKGAVATIFGLGLFAVIVVAGYSMFATGERWSGEELVAGYSETRLYAAKVVLGKWISSGPIAWLIGMGNSASFNPAVLGNKPHFMAVEVLTEEGLVGFALLGTLVWLAARSVFRIYRFVKNDPDLRGVLAAATGVLLFELIISCKQGSLLFNTYIFAFAIILGRVELFYREHAATIFAQQAATAQAHGPTPTSPPLEGSSL